MFSLEQILILLLGAQIQLLVKQHQLHQVRKSETSIYEINKTKQSTAAAT